MLFALAITNLLSAKMYLLKAPATSESSGESVGAPSLAVFKSRLDGL